MPQYPSPQKPTERQEAFACAFDNKSTLDVVVLKDEHSHAYLYTANYGSRSGHDDQLHFDFWWYGTNVAVDAGTYHYNADLPWKNSLSRITVHNTIMIDDRDQMTRASRFLWLDWADVAINEKQYDERSGHLTKIIAQHSGYGPLIHSRTVISLGLDRWQVIDKVSGDGQPQCCRMYWLFLDTPYEWDESAGQQLLKFTVGTYRVCCKLLTSKLKTSLVRADSNSTQGWQSRYYGAKVPALSFTGWGRFGKRITPS